MNNYKCVNVWKIILIWKFHVSFLVHFIIMLECLGCHQRILHHLDVPIQLLKNYTWINMKKITTTASLESAYPFILAGGGGLWRAFGLICNTDVRWNLEIGMEWEWQPIIFQCANECRSIVHKVQTVCGVQYTVLRVHSLWCTAFTICGAWHIGSTVDRMHSALYVGWMVHSAFKMHKALAIMPTSYSHKLAVYFFNCNISSHVSSQEFLHVNKLTF